MVKKNKSARPVFGNELSLHNIARNYVVRVLDVKENDPNFRKPVNLFHKRVVIGSSSSSDIALVQSYLSRYGDESEKRTNTFQEGCHTTPYTTQNLTLFRA